MNKHIYLCILILLPLSIRAQVIITMAGGHGAAFSGDGGPAKDAQLNAPFNVAVDDSGNVFIADANNYRIRKVNRAGVIKTVCGNGIDGNWGDGLFAVDAAISSVRDIAFKNGELYFAVCTNDYIRKVDAAGRIHTVAGIGTTGYSGDGGPGIAAMLNQPTGITFDGVGNLYIMDRFNNRIRKIDTGGTISTIAGTGVMGYSPDGSIADTAKLDLYGGIRSDKYGNLYIGDNNRIRKIDVVTGVLSTVAGNGTFGYSGDGGPASAASIAAEYIAFDTSGNLLIAEGLNHRIRLVDHDGVIHTIAGMGVGSYNGDGGDPLLAHLAGPRGIAVDGKGNIYMADADANAIREITLDTPTAVQEIAIAGANAFQFFPNPTSSTVRITLPEKGGAIEISNMGGERILMMDDLANTEVLEIDVTQWVKGMYVVRWKSAEHIVTEKLMVV